MSLEDVKKEFSNVEKGKQWDWYIQRKNQLPKHQIMLDNDGTELWFDDDEYGEYGLTFRYYIGNAVGIGHLLDALEIPWSGV